jgi:hypothetical protein
MPPVGPIRRNPLVAIPPRAARSIRLRAGFDAAPLLRTRTRRSCARTRRHGRRSPTRPRDGERGLLDRFDGRRVGADPLGNGGLQGEADGIGFDPCASVAGMEEHNGTETATDVWTFQIPGHSLYSNRINLEIDDRHLTAFGDESMGRHLVLLDTGSSKIVGYRMINVADGIVPKAD